jgi:hypothetical protein
MFQVIKSSLKWAGHVTHMGDERCIQGFSGRQREGHHLEDPDVDGMIILRWIFRKCNGGSVDSTDLAQDRDRRRALVDAAMNLRVPKMGEIT